MGAMIIIRRGAATGGREEKRDCWVWYVIYVMLERIKYQSGTE